MIEKKEFVIKKEDGTEEKVWLDVAEFNRVLTYRRKREAYFWKYCRLNLHGHPVPPFNEDEFE
jgi:hypothetical protein